MTTALIFAGGKGQRMNTRAKPKQFLELHGKPIIVYTIEHFERHEEIKNIIVVCVEDWMHELQHLLKIYDVEKVSQIVPGGDGGDRSIYNGLKALEGICEPDDIVLIHDGVRPLINGELLSANIAKVKECGTAITVEAVIESVVRLDSSGCITDMPPREKMYTAKAPQSFHYGAIWELYKHAAKDGIRTIDPAHLCSIYGVEMHTVKSTPNNMKITAPQDYYIFRALFEAMENEQILGV
ncbi:MAG: 2-C-methyl-D-erythritol 4-phosphate cytidylyltransferase [Clostridiales bacterium]|jgi:2-C-methyl-D-erythritol 4-phosphate cytidylyltransferase|nr:2-C-methyl-D-erythritol 4-phosphate cytidylyltransferase [Clostridiales bacterium]